MRTLSVREFNSAVSKTLDAVEKGESFVITRGGKPVARLIRELHADRDSADWAIACRNMLAQMDRGLSLGGLPADYDERTG